MRKIEKKMSTEDSLKIIRTGEYGILSMITNDLGVYGVPLNYVYNNNAIYFHCAKEGYKLRNLKNNNNVSFCVVGKTEIIPRKFSTKYESIIIKGKAFEVKGDEKYQALVKLIEKYSCDFINEGIKYIDKSINKTEIIRIDINEISGKKN